MSRGTIRWETNEVSGHGGTRITSASVFIESHKEACTHIFESRQVDSVELFLEPIRNLGQDDKRTATDPASDTISHHTFSSNRSFLGYTYFFASPTAV